MAKLSKNQIDRLGDRLRDGSHSEADLGLLDEYRRSFGQAYEAVIRAIRQLSQAPTGRPAKSTLSIVEKLRRESIRLSQMQDIAGCRVIVTDVVVQERFIASLKEAFPGASVMDRRQDPSSGYRAVHVIAEVAGKPIEIQVRSALQHLWAEVSEKSSDVLDPKIKYGGGPDEWRKFLTETSQLVSYYEEGEAKIAPLLVSHQARVAEYEVAAGKYIEIEKRMADLRENRGLEQQMRKMREDLVNLKLEIVRNDRIIARFRANMVSLKRRGAIALGVAISRLDERRRRKQ